VWSWLAHRAVRFGGFITTLSYKLRWLGRINREETKHYRLIKCKVFYSKVDVTGMYGVLVLS